MRNSFQAWELQQELQEVKSLCSFALTLTQLDDQGRQHFCARNLDKLPDETSRCLNAHGANCRWAWRRVNSLCLKHNVPFDFSSEVDHEWQSVLNGSSSQTIRELAQTTMKCVDHRATVARIEDDTGDYSEYSDYSSSEEESESSE